MTSIPLSQLAAPSSEIRRDRWGRYLVVPPTGGELVPYTRVTTIANVLDSGGGLAPWKATMTATGIIMRRGLRSQWEALLAEHGDPWYDGESSKAECKRLVEECAAVGGANDAKEVGSSIHAITALVDAQGRIPSHLTAETEAEVNAYLDGRAEAKISIVPQHIERTVVLDAYQVAGTFDRLARVPGFELPLIADLKTGADLSYSWQTIACQLAAYSRADFIYVQGLAKDGSQDKRLPMPEVDQHYGLIFWLHGGQLRLFLVDLDAGWEAFGHSIWTRAWRKQNVSAELEISYATDDGELVSVLEASVAAVKARKQPPAGISDDQEVRSGPARPPEAPARAEISAADSEAVAEDGGRVPVDEERDRDRGSLQARIDRIGQHPQARAELLAAWPKDIPTLQSSQDHSSDQLDAIDRMLGDIEKRWDRRSQAPGNSGVATVTSLFPAQAKDNQATDKGQPA